MNDTVGEVGSNRYLLTQVGAELCAVPLGAIRRVVTPGRISPLPGASKALLGLAEFQGEPLPILDLAQLVGANPGAAPFNPQVIVVEVGPRSSRELVGLKIDAAIEIVDVEEVRLAAAGAGLVRAQVTLEDKTLLVIDPDALGEAV